jgi:predicted unusual protein kinase regulating ubiquinone biosynthesis (AarF/ABC1/UbiB family)
MADHVEGGRIRRFARFATVAARTTGDLLKAGAKKRLLNTDEDEALATALEPTAARLVEVLGSLKGAATKLGQFVSLVDQDTFPEEARKVLTKLLSQAPHRMTYEQAGEVFAAELGEPPEELFESFGEEPFASASMGQVHAARTKDGREVVCKIQFPGVEKAIESDLKNMNLLVKGLSLAGGVLDGREYAEEIAQTLRIELDYRQEVEQLEAYKRAVAPWEGLYVPEVVPELSATRVLTLERLNGPTLLDFSHDESRTKDERYQIACRLVEAVWGPFLREGLIHADPHPGNYIVLEDGRLGVLDFGATKRLSPPFVSAYWRMLTAGLRGDRPAIVPMLELAGFDLRGDPDAMEEWIQVLAEICERPVRNEDYDWGACRISADCKAHFTKNVTKVLRCRAPQEGLMFYRASAGAAGDFRLMRAHGDFRAAARSFMEVARSTIAPEIAAEILDLFPDDPFVINQAAAARQETTEGKPG